MLPKWLWKRKKHCDVKFLTWALFGLHWAHLWTSSLTELSSVVESNLVLILVNLPFRLIVAASVKCAPFWYLNTRAPRMTTSQNSTRRCFRQQPVKGRLRFPDVCGYSVCWEFPQFRISCSFDEMALTKWSATKHITIVWKCMLMTRGIGAFCF